MPNDNPYEPPVNTELSSSDAQSVDHSAWSLLLAFVSLFIAVRFFNFLVLNRNVVALAVSIVWPLVALRLIWRGKVVGYWLMLALFGPLAIGDAAAAIDALSHFGFGKDMFLTAAFLFFPKYLPTFLISLAASTWLVFSPSARLLVRQRKRIAGG